MSEELQTRTFFNKDWFDGNRPIFGPRSHAFWLASSVFDGARAFEGVTPDLDLHCARLNRSAKAMMLAPTMETDAIVYLAREGVKKFAPGAALYIRPMYWAEAGDASSVATDPASTRFCAWRSTKRLSLRPRGSRSPDPPCKNRMSTRPRSTPRRRASILTTPAP